MAQWLDHVRRRNQHNWKTFRQAPLAEISGSLGDLGTLLPLMIALAVQESIRLDATLVFTGLFNILTGIVFGIPLPVQPMKAIASSAISDSDNARAHIVAAAGQWMGVALLIMSATGFLRKAVNFVPVPVVKGIQLGAGLSLISGAGSSLLLPLRWDYPPYDNLYWATFAFLMLIGTQNLPRFHYALVFFGLAIIVAFADLLMTDGSMPRFGFWNPEYLAPGWMWFLNLDSLSFWMAVGQLPLTVLNSIIAVCALSEELLPDLPAPTVTSMGLSVALMNLTGTWFGAMPVCHGAGGLAAQHRFGARSGASIIFLGLVKIILGLFLGETLIDLLARYPRSFLGVMVVAAGMELAKVGNSLNHGANDLWQSAVSGGDEEPSAIRSQRDLTEEERAERWTVMLVTTAGMLAMHNNGAGFIGGMLCHWSFKRANRLASRERVEASPSEEAPLLSS